MPSSARVRSTASTIFFLPSLDRWDRPMAASLRTSGVHPGRLAQGPDEKSGRAGCIVGFIKPLPCRRAALRWGSVARGDYSTACPRINWLLFVEGDMANDGVVEPPVQLERRETLVEPSRVTGLEDTLVET